MVRSLYSGISGLRTHQVGLDVTANNIANVNTIAFKAGRATFKESMVQMLAGPSRPAGNQGGRNPMQVGLGVAVASIDTMLRQGNFQTTGQITDLALEGNAYFAFSNGSGTFYGRNGGMQLDSAGYLVSPTNGWRLQGRMADLHGNYTAASPIGDIRIPWGDKAPAKATENISFRSNLNSDSQALGTVTHTNSFLANSAVIMNGDYTRGDGTTGSYIVGDLILVTLDNGEPDWAAMDISNPPPIIAGSSVWTAANSAAGWTAEKYNEYFQDWVYTQNRMKLTDLSDHNGNSLGIREDDVISFNLQDPNLMSVGAVRELASFAVTPRTVENRVTGELVEVMPTLEDMRKQLEDFLRLAHSTGGTTVTDGGYEWNYGLNGWAIAGTNTPAPPNVFPGGGAPDYFDINVVADDTIHVIIDSTGGLKIINGMGGHTPDDNTDNIAINGLQVTSSRPGSRAFVASAFAFEASIQPFRDNRRPADAGPPPIPAINPGDPDYKIISTGTYTTNAVRIPAAAEDVLGTLFDANGRTLDFTDGDVISINGNAGGKQVTMELNFYTGSGGLGSPSYTRAQELFNTPTPTPDQVASVRTNLSDLMTALAEAFGLPPTDGTIYQRPSISIKDSSDLTQDGIPLGAIVMRGQPEQAFALTGISVVGRQGSANQQATPVRFTSNMTFTEIQTARNTQVHTASKIVYDDAGGEHNMIVEFIPTETPGEWLWEISLAGGDQVILGGNRGRITFGIDGTPSSFTFNDGSNAFRFDPRNGANEVNIRLDYGGPGSLLGITQFESPSTTAIQEQDGYGMGKLQEITIGENGEITGLYDNGQSKSIAIIYVAEFNNPAGLLKMGDSMFRVSNNSGEAALFQPGVGSTTTIKPGALEMSNVELETEFTNMITIQRGYQASARVISTSDQMLQELVQLVR